MQIEEEIIGILENTRDNIRQRMEEKGINATGRTSLSIRVRKEGPVIQLVGGGNSSAWGGKTAPFETIEIGRPPGGDFMKMRAPIYFWTLIKGMEFDSDSHRWAVSTNIAKKIATEGTERYKSHEDVYSTEVREVADKIRAKLFSDIRAEIINAVAAVNVDTNTNKL